MVPLIGVIAIVIAILAVIALVARRRRQMQIREQRLRNVEADVVANRPLAQSISVPSANTVTSVVLAAETTTLHDIDSLPVATAVDADGIPVATYL